MVREIEHIDGDPKNNDLGNLRVVWRQIERPFKGFPILDDENVDPPRCPPSLHD